MSLVFVTNWMATFDKVTCRRVIFGGLTTRICGLCSYIMGLPGPGFHTVGLIGGSSGGGTSGGGTWLGPAAHGVQIEIREGPQLRVAWPARSPANGGGVLWITGQNLAAAAGQTPGCAVGGHAGHGGEGTGYRPDAAAAGPAILPSTTNDVILLGLVDMACHVMGCHTIPWAWQTLLATSKDATRKEGLQCISMTRPAMSTTACRT
jgi:hypothetical protein